MNIRCASLLLCVSAPRRVPVIEGAHQCAASHAGGARATTHNLVICSSAIHRPTPSLPHYATAARRASSCAMRPALPCHVNPLLSFGWEE